MENVRAVLFDIEGTVYSDGQWIPGAINTIKWLIDNGVMIRFVTNKTIVSRQSIWEMFGNSGLAISKEWIVTPVLAAHSWFKNRKVEKGILAVVHPAILEDLSHIPLVEHSDVDYVLVGNMDQYWNMDIFNRALKSLVNGAILTALETNKYWASNTGIRSLAGPFVKALEFASDSTCEVTFGKPSELLFRAILDDICVNATETIMVGDDLVADIQGAKAAGIRSIAVKTGNFLQAKRKLSELNGAEIIDSVAALPSVISIK